MCVEGRRRRVCRRGEVEAQLNVCVLGRFVHKAYVLRFNFDLVLALVLELKLEFEGKYLQSLNQGLCLFISLVNRCIFVCLCIGSHDCPSTVYTNHPLLAGISPPFLSNVFDTRGSSYLCVCEYYREIDCQKRRKKRKKRLHHTISTFVDGFAASEVGSP